MQIETLDLTNFRSFANVTISEIADRKNVIIEPNGSGKSNFLEAIYLVANGTSPRTRLVRDLISWGKNVARISAIVDTDELTLAIEGTHRLLFLNGKKSDIRAFRQRLSVVYFHPPDLNMLSGNPANRRKYLDQMVSQMDISYMYTISYYNKLLAQKNALLRQPAYDLLTLQSVEDQLIPYASEIIFARMIGVTSMNTLLSENKYRINYRISPRSMRELSAGIMREIMQEISAGIADYPSITANGKFGKRRELLRESLRESFSRVREKERELGFSLLGPQRDDFDIFVEDQNHPAKEKNVGGFGSRGEQRMAVVHLKMAESELIFRVRSIRPILLLDDVLSELDEGNKGMIYDLAALQQTFITSADDPKNLEQSFFDGGKRIYL